MGHSQGHYLRMLLLEVFNGDSVVKQENDWNLQIPLVMCTDCRSIYDCLKKDGQTISDKSSAILMLLFLSVVWDRENSFERQGQSTLGTDPTPVCRSFDKVGTARGHAAAAA